MSTPTASVRSGRLTGTAGDGHHAFLGIPYARPPLGGLRFARPLPEEPWSGSRPAETFGPIAPQPPSGLGSYVPGDPTAQDEDCLRLNVWAPDRPGPHPVMVFLHGGAFLLGSGSSAIYRGEHLAQAGVVVVTLNYRLGALGFLAHPSLAEAPGALAANFGLADQLAALVWVRDCIAAFGGDPGCVTVFGESAGAMCAADMLAVEAARGLFRRAVLQSGSVLVGSARHAEKVASELARELGLASVARRELCRVPLAELLAAQERVVTAHGGSSAMAFRPVRDGVLLVADPLGAVADGAAAGVELLIGTNADEFKLFSLAAPELAGIDVSNLEELVTGYLATTGQVAPPAARLVTAQRAARLARGEPSGPRDVFDAIATDAVFRLPALRLALAQAGAGGSAYLYRFDWPSPLLDGALGACHALELPFVFGTLDHPVLSMFTGSSREALALSAAMQSAWVAFARRGDPGGGALGEWPPYEASRRATMVFSSRSGLEEGLPPELAAWEEQVYAADDGVAGT